MELTITDLNTGLSNENLSRIQQKARRIFNKAYESINAVKLTIRDINGPKGGKDKVCQVIIRTKGMPDIVINDKQTTVMSAINISLSRASIALSRKVKRKQKNKPVWSEKRIDEELKKYID